MNKFEENQAEELINTLFDKDISSVEKDRILDQLSQYPEYKSDLTIYTEINNQIQANKVVLEPPIELTKSVFEKVNEIAAKHFKNGFISRSKYVIGAFFLLFLFTSLYLFNTNKTLNNNINNQENLTNLNDDGFANTQSKKITTATHNASVQDSKVVANKVLPKQNSILKKDNSNITLRINTKQAHPKKVNFEVQDKINTNFSSSNDKQIVDANDSKPVMKINFDNNRVKENSSESLLAYSIESSYNQPMRVELPRKINNFGLINLLQNKAEHDPVLLIQYRGMYALSNPEKALQGNNPLISNYCVGIYLRTYENLYLGAEFGNETFSQIYLDPLTQVKYEQSPSVFYFRVGGKYFAKDLKILGIYPSAQLFVGSSSLGPIISTNLSLQYDIIDNLLGIYSGIEGSAVFYSNQSVWYNSKKLGIIGGINLKF
jgi:hypothetical protein